MPETGMRKGRLIAICGIDGSGKATQTALLAQRAEAAGHTVRQLSFPRYGEGFFAELIERYLRGEFAPRAADVSPYLAALPYAFDRWQAAPRLRAWLAEGCVVLCNRYVPANMAHQGSKLPSGAERRAFFEWVSELEYGVLELPRPDLHILLDVPPARAAQLVTGRRAAAGLAEAKDIHERDTGYLEATAGAYREISRAMLGRWEVVACARGGVLLSREEIAEMVWGAANGALY
jgi:dTMP kinase